MCNSVFLVLYVQDTTPGCDQFYRNHFLSFDFMDLGGNSHFGRSGGNIVKSWGIYLFWVFLGATITQPSKTFPLSYPLLTQAPVVDV